MRLSEHEADVIRDAIRRQFGDGARIWLFGSRVRDDARGGDIDLLVEPEVPVAGPLGAVLRAEVEVQTLLDDPRIDILVHQPGEPLEAIQRIAIETGVRL